MANNFHKRHYERVAEAIQEARRLAIAKLDNDEALIAFGAIDLVVAELANVFAGDNGQFKPDRFVTACIVGNNVRARS